MAEALPKSVQRLVKVFSKLPGVGTRTAMRFVLHMVREGHERMAELADALTAVVDSVHLCERCFGLADQAETCAICADPAREGATLCVVESIGDLLALESMGQYRGRYFVLHRLLSPLKGIGPEDLRLPHLHERIKEEGILEVVLGTPLTTDGETTATFIGRVLASEDVKVTRLAAGVPVGGAIEYLDRMTLTRAFLDRKDA